MSRRRGLLSRVTAVATGLALLAGGLTVAAGADQQAQAAESAGAILKGFDPTNIIDDAVMFDGSTMSVAQIQAFLNTRQPSCAPGATCLKSLTADIQAMAANPMCRAMTAKQNQTVAQIISAVGKACDVNPQVILVMLQKEQTLITGRTPYSGETVSLIYRKATGLGCPDTAPCDPAKYGLFAQLYGVAYWLVRYTMPKGTGPGTNYSSVYSWFPVGRPNGVLYNPNAACGARTITIANKATASLYYYTPYQPNDAALAAGWGIGNSCSAYGNRNFYLYYTTWFGSTHYVVTGEIGAAWRAAGGANGALGGPAGQAVTTSAAGGGTSQRFANGAIYSSDAGTVTVTGAVLSEYAAAGGPAGALGWPRKAATTRTGKLAGTVQAFQRGTVYSTSSGTSAVTGATYSKFAASGYESGKLGYPTADAVRSTAKGGATWQAFRGGRIVVSDASGASVVTGDVLARWLQRGAEANILGWPKGDASSVKGVLTAATSKKPAKSRTGTVQAFDGGSVLVVGAKSYTVTGLAAGDYAVHGGPAGSLGWPIGAARSTTANGGGWSQRFAGGTIVWTAKTGARALTGKILALYTARGGTSGSLGWPTATKRDRHGVGGTVSTFTSGRIYSSKAGTVAVRGDVLAKYLQKDGPAGVLGWPTTNAATAKGVTVQRFQRGSISWTAKTGAKASTK